MWCIVRNEIVLVMDSVGWEEFKDANTPNLDKFNPRRAFSFCMYTTPSVNSMLRGSMPVTIERKYARKRYYEGYCKSENAIIPLSLASRGYKTYLVSGNLLISKKLMKWKNEVVGGSSWFKYGKTSIGNTPYTTEKLIDWFIKNYKEPFYSFMIFIDTHIPYMCKDNNRVTQLKAIEHLDKMFKKLYDNVPKGTRIIVTADHSDCWYKGKLFGHNPKRYSSLIKQGLLYKLLEVFIVEVIK